MKRWNLSFLVLAIASLGFGNVCAEQGCPDGMVPNAAPGGTPGQNMCIPMPGLTGQSGGTSPQPRIKWASRWGAFASDPITSKVGLASEMSSKGKAEKAALAHCRSKGGVQCKPLFSYHDQCGVVVWGKDRTGAGQLIWASAVNKELAGDNALMNCEKDSDGCKIFFAECSYPERIE